MFKNRIRLEKFLELNRSVFPFLVSFSFFLLFLESYSYIGFLRKFILVDSRFFMILSFISIFFLFYQRLKSKIYNPNSTEMLVIDLNLLLFLPILAIYLAMVYLNAKNYPNYIFAKYHIQPQNFINIVYLSFAVLLLKLVHFYENFNLGYYFDIFFTSRVNRLEDERERFLFIILSIFLVFYSMDNFRIVTNRIISDFAFMLTHLNYGYNDKMRNVWGFYYDYMNFVESNIPSNSTILVPPQSHHWLSVGNMALSRYFLYPRKMLHGELRTIPSDGYDYVVIAKGLWQNQEVEWGWPKVYIKAEEILYINPFSLEVTRVKKDFDPNDDFNMQAWGLIKVKKD